MGDSADSTAKPVIGVDLVAVRDLAASLESATDAGLEFICAPLFHPRFRRDTAGVSERRGGPGTRSDVVLECARWTACVVGKLSPWIDVDATESSARTASEAAFKEEVSWASHLHVPAIAVNLRRGGCANLALHISQAISPTGSTVFFWVRVPVLWPATADGGSDAAQSSLSLPSATPASRAESDAPWLAWNELRSLVEGHAQVGVALELCDRVPTAAALERWAADRVKAVFVPTRLFVFNRAGYPTLPAHLQAAVHALWRFRVQFVVTGRSAAPGGSYRHYAAYLSHCAAQAPPEPGLTVYGQFCDLLQAPLQPLADNLESETYETFERDPAKYDCYEAAMTGALRRWRPAGGPAAGGAAEEVTVLVVGAGRGPLVRRCIVAAAAAGRAVRIFAVEKNPNAVITLRNMIASEPWGHLVTLIPGDMRALLPSSAASAAGGGRSRARPAPPALGTVDLLVSELLGSFGDNELSPECLDGVQAFLRPAARGGLGSIPAASTSYLAPVMTPKLWGDIRGNGAGGGGFGGDPGPAAKELKWFETPYVVRLHRHVLLAPPQPVFTFLHPNPEAVGGRGPDNRRFARLRFSAPEAGLMHGFAGYFDCTLLPPAAAAAAAATAASGSSAGDAGVIMGTVPGSATPGMASWFPIFFPLRDPVLLRPGDTVEVLMWRCCGPGRVWYEWALAAPTVSPLHNPGGRSYWIGL